VKRFERGLVGGLGALEAPRARLGPRLQLRYPRRNLRGGTPALSPNIPLSELRLAVPARQPCRERIQDQEQRQYTDDGQQKFIKGELGDDAPDGNARGDSVGNLHVRHGARTPVRLDLRTPGSFELWQIVRAGVRAQFVRPTDEAAQPAAN
jgi:hypothetical protein